MFSHSWPLLALSWPICGAVEEPAAPQVPSYHPDEKWTTTPIFKKHLAERLHGRGRQWRCLEVGVYRGFTTKVLSETCASVIAMEYDLGFVKKLPRTRAKSNVFVISASSHSSWTTFTQQPLQFVLIDGDHTYAAVLQDLSRALSLPWRPHVIAFHDYCEPDVSRAVAKVVEMGLLKCEGFGLTAMEFNRMWPKMCIGVSVGSEGGWCYVTSGGSARANNTGKFDLQVDKLALMGRAQDWMLTATVPSLERTPSCMLHFSNGNIFELLRLVERTAVARGVARGRFSLYRDTCQRGSAAVLHLDEVDAGSASESRCVDSGFRTAQVQFSEDMEGLTMVLGNRMFVGYRQQTFEEALRQADMHSAASATCT